MRILAPTIIMLASTTLVASASAQTVSSASEAQSRTRVIAASFSKFKNVSKTKRGITKSKYLRVTSEPAVRTNPADYSGVYEVSDFGLALNLNVDSRGVVTGSGTEPLTEDVRRTFTLRDGRIQGALLTATKVYANGRSERLEGAFMNRMTFESPTDKGSTIFGLGTIGKTIQMHGQTFDRFFYEKTR